MESVGWETITQIFDKNKETIIPIVAFTTLGGLIFVYRGKIFGNRSTETFSKHQSHILNLPPETRKCIWEKLCYKDILNLRLVCEHFKTDVDTLVGVRGRLNSFDEERFEFFRSVALKRCHVTDLEVFPGENIFAAPYQLEFLSLYERTQFSVETIQNLLKDCNNVRHLFLRFSHLPEGSIITTALSRIVLNSLRTKSCLKEFQFVKIPSYTRTDKSIPRDISHFSFPVSTTLSYVDIEIPDVLPEHLAEWKYFLEQQTKLETLIADFGGVYWKFFSSIISKNQETLKAVCLYQLRTSDENSRDEFPFDWGILHGCQKLEILQITGFKWIHEPMPSVNFSAFPVDNLLELCVRRVTLGRADIRRIYHEMPHLKSGSFENMGTEGDAAALDLMMETRQDEIDREIHEWENAQRTMEILSDCMFYTCAFAVISAYGVILYRYYHYDENPNEYMK